MAELKNTEQPLRTIIANVGDGFWSVKSLYVGQLKVYNDRLVYDGIRKSFMMNNIPFNIELKVDEISTISFENSRVVKVMMQTNTFHTFLVGDSGDVRYTPETSGRSVLRSLGGAVASSTLDADRSKSNELLLQELYDYISSLENYKAIKLLAPHGVKSSSLFSTYRIIIIALSIIPLVLLIYALIKLMQFSN